MAKVTGLSGNEIYCLALKKYSAGELVVGNSVNSMGFLGSLGAGLGNVLGGEVPQVTRGDPRGPRQRHSQRMTRGGGATGASGVAGRHRRAALLQRQHGIPVRRLLRPCDGRLATACSPAPAMRRSSIATWTPAIEPIQHVFGNIAYSMGVGGGLLGSLKTLARGEIREFSDVFNQTRHAALDRVVGAGARDRANAVVGIRTVIQPWAGTHEMMMSGTAAVQPGAAVVRHRQVRSPATSPARSSGR